MSNEKLENMIKHLQETNCRSSSLNIEAEFLNEINGILGCGMDVVKNNTVPNDNTGSRIVLASIYQVLLLLKRVEDLEGKVKELSND